MDRIALKNRFSRQYRIALNPKGSVSEHWGTPTSFWSLNFRRLSKEVEISDFQLLLGCLERTSLSNIEHKRISSLETNRVSSVKSLSKHLSPVSPMDLQLENAFKDLEAQGG